MKIKIHLKSGLKLIVECEMCEDLEFILSNFKKEEIEIVELLEY